MNALIHKSMLCSPFMNNVVLTTPVNHNRAFHSSFFPINSYAQIVILISFDVLVCCLIIPTLSIYIKNREEGMHMRHLFEYLAYINIKRCMHIYILAFTDAEHLVQYAQ